MNPSELNALSFEEAFAQLESVVQQLEGSSVPLEDALRLFEQGQQLATYCQNLLDKADLRVSQLIGDKIVPLDE